MTVGDTYDRKLDDYMVVMIISWNYAVFTWWYHDDNMALTSYIITLW